VCHAITGVSPSSAAPLCTVCHQSGTALPFANCTSCHARPPSGTVYPDVAGRHAKHNALASVTGVCGTCHNGLDTGSLAHYNRANARPGKDALRVPPGDVAFGSTYIAKAGAASFSNIALTCTNMSCHGAVTAPSWQTGTINVNTDAGCRACHKLGTASGNPENNSEYSGLHSFHLSTAVGGAILCTDCHNMANGTTGALNHFLFLNTAALEGPAAQTVEPNGSAANYNAANQTCGNFTCHTVSHSDLPWSGGASHSVPFTGAAHTSVTSVTFPGSCSACHDDSAPSTKTGPVCQTCHVAASPLTAANCTSCHASPPNGGAGAVYANIAGAHAAHIALNGAGTPISCDTCHNGLGTNTLNHYNMANGRAGAGGRVPPGDAAFLTTYNAESGASSFNSTAFSCSNVSCHGGVARSGGNPGTPLNWQTGNLTVNTACTSCHSQGTTQFNSYNSGDHGINSDHSDCTNCHNTTTLAVNHFTNLSTTAMEGPASATIGGGTTSIPAGNYNPTTRSCSPSCHGNETW
jgi:predicted CxxxxCH...CXXCH cytochrome family protein